MRGPPGAFNLQVLQMGEGDYFSLEIAGRIRGEGGLNPRGFVWTRYRVQITRRLIVEFITVLPFPLHLLLHTGIYF